MDKWFYAGWAIRRSNFRLPAYKGGLLGTSVQRAALQTWDDVSNSVGAAFSVTSVRSRLDWPDCQGGADPHGSHQDGGMALGFRKKYLV